MSKKKKTGFPDDLWSIYFFDRFAWGSDEVLVAGPMPREEAKAEFNRLTDDHTKNTEHDGKAMTYYKLRQVG